VNRWIILISAILFITLIGGAGYLGVRSIRAEARETPEAPITVTVSRGEVVRTVTAPGQVTGRGERILSTGLH
jgi:multidrug efflux pump subunit AcrA (membrane-fusion protein)